MNIVALAGQLGRDAEVRFLPNGDPVASFSVADSQGKDKSTIWWSCSLFGKRAESLAPYLLKGQSVTVTGQLTEREYTNKDGLKVKAQEIRVGDVALQGGKQGGKAADPHAPAPKGYQKPADDFDNQDVPF